MQRIKCTVHQHDGSRLVFRGSIPSTVTCGTLCYGWHQSCFLHGSWQWQVLAKGLWIRQMRSEDALGDILSPIAPSLFSHQQISTRMEIALSRPITSFQLESSAGEQTITMPILAGTSYSDRAESSVQSGFKAWGRPENSNLTAAHFVRRRVLPWSHEAEWISEFLLGTGPFSLRNSSLEFPQF